DKMISPGSLDYSPGWVLMDTLSRVWSPYQMNPANYHPLREILQEQIDFGRLGRSVKVKAFVCASNVFTNRGDRFDWQEADAVSKAVCRRLGQLKTKEALELGVDLPRDSRAPVLVFITAVHSASPEYNFEVLEYLPDETTIRVFGISRYDRIAK